MIWDGSPEEVEDWFDKVFDKKHRTRPDEVTFVINEGDIE